MTLEELMELEWVDSYRGEAHYAFRNIEDGETYFLVVEGNDSYNFDAWIEKSILDEEKGLVTTILCGKDLEDFAKSIGTTVDYLYQFLEGWKKDCEDLNIDELTQMFALYTF